jgi:L-aspartate oxidase
MGGIVTDSYGATSIAGLYAVGETASTGVHGANRLASNSLLECFVFGERLAQKVCHSPITNHQPPITNHQSPNYLQSHPNDCQSLETIATIKANIQNLTWQAAGICRTQTELETALIQINQWRSQLAQLHQSSRPISRLTVETRNLADYAYLLMRSALFRTESRGAHYRLDYPESDRLWQAHTVINGEDIRRLAVSDWLLALGR